MAVWEYSASHRKWMRAAFLGTLAEGLGSTLPYKGANLRIEELWSIHYWEADRARFTEPDPDIQAAERRLADSTNESSYLRPRSGSPVRYGRRMYDHWHHPRTLKSFVVNRGLVDPYPGGITLKPAYVVQLDKADREWSFRFMDLPPEMRVLVYRQLLVSQAWTDGHDNAELYPAILRTSKQVHEEARDLLYDENVFSVKLEYATNLYPDYLSRRIRVHRDVQRAGTHAHRYAFVPYSLDEYPSFFRKIRKLSITVDDRVLAPGPSANHITQINQFLMGLASFMMEGHRLRSLHLNINSVQDVSDLEFQQMLYPLRRLRHIQILTTSGDVPDKLADMLRSELRGIEPLFNTIRQWQLLQEELHAQIRLVETVVPSECQCGLIDIGECECEDNENPRVRELTRMDEDMHMFMYEHGCSSSRHEEHFLARLADLRDELHRIDLTELRKLLSSLTQKQKSRRKYQGITDSERLDEARKLVHERQFSDDIDPDSDEPESDLAFRSDDEWTIDMHLSEIDVVQVQQQPAGDDHGGQRPAAAVDLDALPLLDEGQIEAIFEEYEPEVLEEKESRGVEENKLPRIYPMFMERNKSP